MKIYTRTGDSGETALFGGGRVPKNHLRVETYGEVDELNATLGLLGAEVEAEGWDTMLQWVREIQADLFAIGAHLATPTAGESDTGAAAHLPPLPTDRIEQMEGWIDAADQDLPPLKSFVLPGGTETAARCHLARAVCRRAERRVTSLTAQEPIEAAILVYLNRLSDFLFTTARVANRRAGIADVPWQTRSSD